MAKKRSENQTNDGPKPIPKELLEKMRKWKMDRVLKNLHTGELTILDPPEKATQNKARRR